MFLRPTSPDTREVNKSKVRFPFWKLYRDRSALYCVQNEKKNITIYFLFILSKIFFQGEIFIFTTRSSLACECNFLFDIYRVFFNSTKYSRHVTLKFNERMMSKSIRDSE